MKRISRRIIVSAALAGLVTPLTGVSATAATPDVIGNCTWQMTRFPAPPGAVNHIVSGTDGKGNYSGYVQRFTSPNDLVLWNRGATEGSVHPAPAGFESPYAAGENRSGVIVVVARRVSDSGNRVSTYTGGHEATGVYRELPLPAGGTSASASGINDRGEVAGIAYLPNRPGVPARWPADGGVPTLLDKPLPWLYDVRAIDEDGTVLLNTEGGPYLWKRNGELVHLATPAGHHPATPTDISNGVVVGEAWNDNYSQMQGFLWRTPDSPLAIEGSSGGNYINSRGLVAGRTLIERKPAVWLSTKPLSELPAPNGGGVRFVGDDLGVVGLTNDGPVIWRPNCS